MKTICACLSTLIALVITPSIRARVAVIVLAMLTAPFTANAQTTTRYHVVPLQEMSSGGVPSCVPTAINTNDVVVGFCDANANPFAVRWHSGTPEDLGRWEDGVFSRAWGINALGQIVGDGDDGDNKGKALLRTATGWIDIEGSGGSYQTAYGITDSGVIFGNYSSTGSPATATWDPVFWTSDGDGKYEREPLFKPEAGPGGAWVWAVNSFGVAVGWVHDASGNRAGFWRNDAAHSLQTLATPPGQGSAEALGVSDDGHVVGRTYGSALQHAVLWPKGNYAAVDLSTLPGGARSVAYGVNTSGQVVGTSFDAAGFGHAFIYQDVMLDLTALLDTAASAWTIKEAVGINNQGTIIAIATLNNVRHPVMLVPFEKVKEAQTISFVLPDGPFRFGDLPFTVSATSTSGLPVSFRNEGGACSVESTTATIVGAGMCQVIASQGGDTDWLAAEEVIREMTIGKGAATISFDDLAQTFDGTVKTVSTSTAPQGLSVQLSFTGTPQNAGNYPVTATIDDANYEGSASGTLIVGKANASIVVTPYSVTYDGTSHTATAVATGVNGEDVSLFMSLDATTHTDAGEYLADAWSFAGDLNYNDAIGTVNNAIAQATQSIAFDALANRTFGDAPFAVSATGGPSGNAVSFAAAGNCTVAGNQVTIGGAGSCMITASQAGNANYSAAPEVSRSFAIAQATQSISFGALANRTFGDAPFTVSATGGASGNPVTFDAAGNCTLSGNLVTITAAGSCTITASQAGSANYVAAAPVARSFTIAPAAPPEGPLANPGPQTNQEGDQVELSLVSGRPRGTFSVLNLPDKLKIDNKGVIRGHIGRGAASPSPYNVVVTYTSPDGVSSTVAFTWTILPSGPKGQGNHGENFPNDDKKRVADDRH